MATFTPKLIIHSNGRLERAFGRGSLQKGGVTPFGGAVLIKKEGNNYLCRQKEDSNCKNCTEVSCPIRLKKEG